MTPTEIETEARNAYNAVGDSFFSQSEIFNLIWKALNELAHECLAIENTYTTSTVASQQAYSYPSNTISIKRVTYEGKKLKPVTFREDDAITGLNQSTTSTGTPQFYFIWDSEIYLRPIPSAVGTLKVYSYNQHTTISSTTTLEIPAIWHMALVDFVVAQMAAKDSNFTAAQYYKANWESTKLAVKRWNRKRLRGDSFAAVQDEEELVESYFGVV